MGTTESVFADEDEDQGSESTATLAEEANRSGQDRKPKATRSGQLKPQQRVIRRKELPKSEVVKRVAPSAPVRLSGLVLGLPKSGKHTLLSRLEGKDPFDGNASDSSRNQILVPYQPPQELGAWDPGIQLQVNQSQSVPKDQFQDGIDFGVILINPSHDHDTVADYLRKTIHSLIHLQTAMIPGEGGTKKSEPNPQSRHKPYFCLCLLLNFRDQQESASSWLEQSDIQMITLEVLQEYPLLEPDRLVLQCGPSSLYDCYGLDLLHHFVYMAYAQRKRYELELLLDKVHTARIAANSSIPFTSYEEFSEMAALPEIDTSSKGDKKEDPGNYRRERRARKESKEGDGGILDRQNDAPKETTGQRKIFAGESHDGLQKKEPRDATATAGLETESKMAEALEDFLASDSDTEEPRQASQAEESSVTSRQGIGKDDDDDDDDDDDFFYDTSGARQHVEDTTKAREQREGQQHESFDDLSDVESPAAEAPDNTSSQNASSCIEAKDPTAQDTAENNDSSESHHCPQDNLDRETTQQVVPALIAKLYRANRELVNTVEGTASYVENDPHLRLRRTLTPSLNVGIPGIPEAQFMIQGSTGTRSRLNFSIANDHFCMDYYTWGASEEDATMRIIAIHDANPGINRARWHTLGDRLSRKDHDRTRFVALDWHSLDRSPDRPNNNFLTMLPKHYFSPVKAEVMDVLESMPGFHSIPGVEEMLTDWNALAAAAPRNLADAANTLHSVIEGGLGWGPTKPFLLCTMSWSGGVALTLLAKASSPFRSSIRGAIFFQPEISDPKVIASAINDVPILLGLVKDDTALPWRLSRSFKSEGNVKRIEYLQRAHSAWSKDFDNEILQWVDKLQEKNHH